MNSSQLIVQTENLWKTLQNNLLNWSEDDQELLKTAQFRLMATDDAIRTIKSWVIHHDFDCWENEITFFKKLKPNFIGTFIYYSKVIALLSSIPLAGTKLTRKIYEGEFDYLQYFSFENKDFISYYRRNATYLDLKYFLRFKYDLDVKLAPDVHSYDERFSSSHDHLVSQIIANDWYEAFLKKQLNQLKSSPSEHEPRKKNLDWTASKVALTELIFALHQTRCFNGGNTDLSETVKWFETHFNIDLGNYHKTMSEISNRKTDKTKFLHLLNENLTNYLDSLDE